jgi:hypothetical protein
MSGERGMPSEFWGVLDYASGSTGLPTYLLSRECLNACITFPGRTANVGGGESLIHPGYNLLI